MTPSELIVPQAVKFRWKEECLAPTMLLALTYSPHNSSPRATLDVCSIPRLFRSLRFHILDNRSERLVHCLQPLPGHSNCCGHGASFRTSAFCRVWRRLTA